MLVVFYATKVVLKTFTVTGATHSVQIRLLAQDMVNVTTVPVHVTVTKVGMMVKYRAKDRALEQTMVYVTITDSVTFLLIQPRN